MAPKRAGAATSGTPPKRVLDLKSLKASKVGSPGEKDPFFKVHVCTYQDEARKGEPTGALMVATRVSYEKNAEASRKFDANRLDGDMFGRASVRNTWGRMNLDDGEKGQHWTFRCHTPVQEDKDRLAYAEAMDIPVERVPKHEWTPAQLAKCTLTVFPVGSAGAIGIAGPIAPLKTKLEGSYTEATPEHGFRGWIVEQEHAQGVKQILADLGYVLDEYDETTTIG